MLPGTFLYKFMVHLPDKFRASFGHGRCPDVVHFWTTSWRCTFLYNVPTLSVFTREFVDLILDKFVLHKNGQRPDVVQKWTTRTCTLVQVSLGETCTFLVLTTYVASDWTSLARLARAQASRTQQPTRQPTKEQCHNPPLDHGQWPPP